MTKDEAIGKLSNIKFYLTAGNPIWDADTIRDAMDMAIEALKQTQWIPCSERLPEEGNTTYMTTLDYGELGRATGQRFFYGKHIGWEDDAVVAWMPLPKPYEGGTE